MKLPIFAVSACLVCNVALADFWTVTPTGVISTASGKVGINIGSAVPTGPNPADAVWAACNGNWVYFHSDANGEAVDEKAVDRMLTMAVSALKTGTKIRVNINRKASDNTCYTSQIFDQGA